MIYKQTKNKTMNAENYEVREMDNDTCASITWLFFVYVTGFICMIN